MKKFDDCYNKVITESYHRQMGLMWTESAAKKSIENMMKKAFNADDILSEFDDFIIPKKWFSFKKLFKSKPEVTVESYSGKNCDITAKYSEKYSGKELEKLFFGDPKGEQSYGGITLNEKISSSDLDISEDEDDVSDRIVNVIFKFMKVNFVSGIKGRKMKNPNYITSFEGNVFLGFDDDEKKLLNIGTIKYSQSRYANMDPPKPIKDQIRDVWNKPNKDFGIWGVLAQKGMAAAANGIFGGLFSKTVQEESFDINLSTDLKYTNNIAKDNKTLEELNKLFNEIYSSETAEFVVDQKNETDFKVSFEVNGTTIFTIDIGGKK